MIMEPWYSWFAGVPKSATVHPEKPSSLCNLIQTFWWTFPVSLVYFCVLLFVCLLVFGIFYATSMIFRAYFWLFAQGSVLAAFRKLFIYLFLWFVGGWPICSSVLELLPSTVWGPYSIENPTVTFHMQGICSVHWLSSLWPCCPQLKSFLS